jgi:hypothetical protein
LQVVIGIMRWKILYFVFIFILLIGSSFGDDPASGSPLQLEMMEGPVTILEPSNQGSGSSYQLEMMEGPVTILEPSGQGQQVQKPKSGFVTDLKLSPMPSWQLNTTKKEPPLEGSFKLYPIPGWVLGSGSGNQGQQNPPSNSPKNPEKVIVTEGSITVYYGGQMIPLTSYQITGGNYLWIEALLGWTQYISVPQYSSLSLMAYTPTGGRGMIYEIYPSTDYQGSYLQNVFNFYPGYNRLYFRGDITGRHVLTFVLNDQPSNSVVIDVLGGTTPESSPMLGTGKGTTGGM